MQEFLPKVLVSTLNSRVADCCKAIGIKISKEEISLRYQENDLHHFHLLIKHNRV